MDDGYGSAIGSPTMRPDCLKVYSVQVDLGCHCELFSDGHIILSVPAWAMELHLWLPGLASRVAFFWLQCLVKCLGADPLTLGPCIPQSDSISCVLCIYPQ